jgi:hypothetical protein
MNIDWPTYTSLCDMDITSPPETDPTTVSNSPDSDTLAQRRGTLSSIYTSTASSSSPEFTTDTVITPESDEDQPSTALSLKVEELEEQALADIDEAKPSTADQPSQPGPRKRGRPRKHPIVDQKKASHARSKTGCGTCSKFCTRKVLEFYAEQLCPK